MPNFLKWILNKKSPQQKLMQLKAMMYSDIQWLGWEFPIVVMLCTRYMVELSDGCDSSERMGIDKLRDMLRELEWREREPDKVEISKELFERFAHFQELLTSKESDLLALQSAHCGASKVLDEAIEIEIVRIRNTGRILQEQIDNVLGTTATEVEK